MRLAVGQHKVCRHRSRHAYRISYHTAVASPRGFKPAVICLTAHLKAVKVCGKVGTDVDEPEPRCRLIRRYSGKRLEEPRSHFSEHYVVKRVVYYDIGLPVLMEGGCTLTNPISPRRICFLAYNLVGGIRISVVGQRT